MPAKALQRRGREARQWLFDACFPLWSERGVSGHGFLEALDLQHKPIEETGARVRVQARQTYLFAQAFNMGWSPRRAEDLTRLGLEVLEGVCRRPDGQFGRRLDLTEGTLIDETVDLYDIAFALYALGHVYKAGACGAQSDMPGRAGQLIDETFEAIDTHLSEPSGGYRESLPWPEHRMQNPHMHLFEACLALAEISGDKTHLARASRLQALCLEHFIDPATGTLGEYFNQEDWSPVPGEPGNTIEPGHQFEWVWLLNEHVRLGGQRLPDEAHRLYMLACQTLDGEGRAAQTCLRDGHLVDTSRRTWPQTEALKAHLAMWQAGDEAAGARAVASFDILMDEYLTPEGGWIDHYDGGGQVLSLNMPASTGYHVVLAFSDLIRAVEA